MNLCSKPTPIHGPLQNMILIIHNREVTSVGYHKEPQKNIFHLSQKVSHASKIIDPVINGFIPN